MKRNSLYKWMCRVVGVTLGMVGLAACSSEEDELGLIQGPSGSSEAIASDAFIVDYGVGAETATRAEKAVRIKSLFYLVYDSDGKLLKVRTIPDITTQTKWPLNRENMTWAQREALKDTLNSHNTYTAFFLANVQSEAALTASSGQTDLLLNPGCLSTAQLCLPQKSFDDTNMMYLWKETIKYQRPDGITEDKDVPRNHPLSKQIVLRRILSRMELTRAEVSDVVLKKKLVEKAADYKGHLETELKSLFAEFKENVYKQLGSNAFYEPNCNYLYTLLSNKCAEMAASIFQQENAPSVPDYLSALQKQVTESAAYQSRTADWSGFTSSLMQIQKPYNRFSLETLAGSHVEVADETMVFPYPNVGGTACWIGFSSPGKAEGEVKPEAESLTGIHLWKDGASVLELSFATPLDMAIGKNEQANYVCDPIAFIEAASYQTQASFHFTLNMETVFKMTLDDFLDLRTSLTERFAYDGNLVKKEVFKEAIEAVAKQYGSWVAMTLSFTLPDNFNYTANIAAK